MLPCAACAPCRHKHGMHAPGVPREDGAGLGAPLLLSSPGQLLPEGPVQPFPTPAPHPAIRSVCTYRAWWAVSSIIAPTDTHPTPPPQQGAPEPGGCLGEAGAGVAGGGGWGENKELNLSELGEGSAGLHFVSSEGRCLCVPGLSYQTATNQGP